MSTLSFSIGARDFDAGLLPQEARIPGTPAFSEAVTEFLQKEFQDFGGHATFLVDTKHVAVSWNPDSKKPDPLDTILTKIQRGQLAEAIQLLELLLSHQPDNATLLYNLGVALSDAGRLSRAEPCLRRAVRLSPKRIEAQIALGVALSRRGKNAEAAGILKTAVSSEPHNPWARRNLGGVLLKEARYEEAAEHLRRATELQPDDQQAWLGLGDALRHLGQPKQAEAAYNQAITLNPHNDLAELARQASTKLAQTTFDQKVARVPRQDAVMYCLHALKEFAKMPKEEVQKIGFEIAVLGRNGFDVNSADQKYRLKSMAGTFSGLQLVSYMYVAFQQILPGQDIGFDLSAEYSVAEGMFKGGA